MGIFDGKTEKGFFMKKQLFTVVLLTLCICSFASAKTNADAKRLMTGTKVLESGKTYQYDINGDKKKENVRVVTIGDGDKYTVTSTIYANGKKYCKIKRKGSYGQEVILCDLYAKKKGMNFIIYDWSDSDVMGSMSVVQCKKKKGVVIAKMKSGFQGLMEIFRLGAKPTSMTEEGTFCIKADTPFYLNNFGCYYSKMKMKVVGKKIKLLTRKECPYNSKYTYLLKRDMPVSISKEPKQKADMLVSAGEKVKVLAIRPCAYDEGSGKRTSFVKVKILSSGKTGWVYDEPQKDSVESYYCKESPAWG